MPQKDVSAHTIHALCRYFAERPRFALDCGSFSWAVQSQLPTAEVMSGTSVSEGVSELCTWIKVGERVFDVQSIAKRRRAVVAHTLKCDDAWLADRVLVAGTESEVDNSEPGDLEKYIQALENWVLPSCAACCGKSRAHTLDNGCISLWKAELLAGRGASRAVNRAPVHDPTVDHNECREAEYMRQLALE